MQAFPLCDNCAHAYYNTKTYCMIHDGCQKKSACGNLPAALKQYWAKEVKKKNKYWLNAKFLQQYLNSEKGFRTDDLNEW